MPKKSTRCPYCHIEMTFEEYMQQGALYVCDNCGHEVIIHERNKNKYPRKIKEIEISDDKD